MLDYSSYNNKEIFKNNSYDDSRIFSYVTVNPKRILSINRNQELDSLSKLRKVTENKLGYESINSAKLKLLDNEPKVEKKKHETKRSSKLLWLNDKPVEIDKVKEQSKKSLPRSSTPRYTQEDILKKITEKKKAGPTSPPTIVNNSSIYYSKNKLIHPKPTKLETKTSLRSANKVDQITQTESVDSELKYKKLRTGSKKSKKSSEVINSKVLFKDFLKRIFVASDDDKDGFITAHDAENILIHLNERFGIPYNVNDVKAFFDRVFTLFRGYFSFNEFCKAFNLD